MKIDGLCELDEDETMKDVERDYVQHKKFVKYYAQEYEESGIVFTLKFVIG